MRIDFAAPENALTCALAARREPYVDLTVSNPTAVGLPVQRAVLPEAASYEPHPRGLLAAREAVAAYHGVSADRVILSASTSEAYAWLFKLLCDPGDSVLVPRPSYPLFEHLTQLEGVRAEPYDLEYHGRWSIDFDGLEHASPAVRAVLVVTPNNPTGSFVSASEVSRLGDLCRARGWALVADEVFADYRIECDAAITDLAARDTGCLTFSLGGFSKTLGLPQLKLGWIVAGGPPAVRQQAIEGLELIADSFLSVGTPVQLATPALLAAAAPVRAAIEARIRDNFAALRRTARRFPACEVLRTEGGWSAVVRVPATRSEEQLVLELLGQAGVLVHPGYFFDFRREAFVVVSLLPPPGVFVDAIHRILRLATN